MIRLIMWHWDQGHLQYCQFDALRKIASFVVSRDFKTAEREELLASTGLEFKSPSSHSPWRQYSRILKLCLLVSEARGTAVATPIARILSQPGAVTCDEYLHFIAQSFTDPSPALTGWERQAEFRFPLLFALKYLLAKCAVEHDGAATLNEIIGAYRVTGFVGDEDQGSYSRALSAASTYAASALEADRQARESLQAIAQISYFHLSQGTIRLALDPKDALEIFNSLQAIRGERAHNRDAEIRRLAGLFRDGSTQDFFGYPNTIVTEVVESGFEEGSKMKRTHVIIERNRELRRAFFAQRLDAVCDLCSMDTSATYPWTGGVLDLHHLLPLASGARVTKELRGTSTTFADLVAVCPSCHRAVHRYYERWLRDKRQEDFVDKEQSRHVYQTVKLAYGGAVYV